jgi:hypothetical protein
MLQSLRFHLILSAFALTLCVGSAAFAQTPARTPNVRIPVPQESPTPQPSPTPNRSNNNRNVPVAATAQEIAEAAIFIYGAGGGRPLLDRIRKTTAERGKTTFIAGDGKTEVASYQRFIIRGDRLGNQQFPNATYSLIYKDDQMYGVLNRVRFDPREDTAKDYENSIFRGLEMLLRYKENESTLTLAGKEKDLGVDLHLIDVTDKKGRTARFHVSAKTYQIKAISYEEGGVKYKRKFYNYNYAQGTLVPFRSVLTADGKVIEETEIGTITFGQKVDENLFSES